MFKAFTYDEKHNEIATTVRETVSEAVKDFRTKAKEETCFIYEVDEKGQRTGELRMFSPKN